MSNICIKCGSQFDSPCCPNCGTPATIQTQINQSQQMPQQPPYQPNQFGQFQQPPYQSNQFQQPQKRKNNGCLITILIVVGIFMFFGIISTILNDDDPKVVDKDNGTTDVTAVDKSSTPVPENTSFSIGETVKLNDILVTLIGVTTSEGSDISTPSDGNVFLLCEFEIENNSDSDIIVSSIVCFEAYCDDYTMSQSLAALLAKGDKGQLDGTVAAGKKMNGVICYEVSKDWKKLEINYTPDFLSSKDIKFIAENK